jgi:hypothetical protein
MAYAYDPWASLRSGLANRKTSDPNYATYSILQPFTQSPGTVAPFSSATTAKPAASGGVVGGQYGQPAAPTQGIQNPTGSVPGALPYVNPWQVAGTTTPVPGDLTATQIGNPAQVAMPDVYGDMKKVIPGLAGMNAAAGSVISNDLSGRISPDVQRAIQTEAAVLGAAGGMPGSVGQAGSLFNFSDLATIGRTSDANQQRGLASYGDFLKTISVTQTTPAGVQAGVNEANATAQNRVAEANAAALNNFAQFNLNGQQQAQQWNAGQLNNVALANAAAGNTANTLNTQIADRNATNAAAADPWLALNYAADLLARNSAATSGKTYTSLFAPNTSTGAFGGWASGSPAGGTIDPWTAYLNKAMERQNNGMQYSSFM